MRSRTAGAILLLSGLFFVHRCVTDLRRARGPSSGAGVAAAGWNKQAAAAVS